MKDRSLGTRSMIAGAVLALVLVNWRDIVSSLPRVARAFATVMESASAEPPVSPRGDSTTETISWESRIDDRRVADREIVPAAKPIFDAGDALPMPVPVRFHVGDEAHVTAVAALDPQPIINEVVIAQPGASPASTTTTTPASAPSTAAPSGAVAAPGTSVTVLETLPPEILGLFASATDKEKQPTQNHLRRGFLKLKFNAVLPGQVEVRLGQRSMGPIHVSQSAVATLQEIFLPIAFSDLSMRAAEELRVVYDPDDDPQTVRRASPESKPILANIDNTPPRVVSVRLTGNPGAAALLEVRFADSDLSSTTVEELDVAYSRNFVVTRSGGKPTFESTTNIPEHHAQLAPPGDVVHIPLGMLVSDTYRLEIKDGLTDQHGNIVEGARLFYFSSFPDGPTGPHVEFPPFVDHQPDPLIFNPGDKVETRVARLYYFRDAHRVAQIINRNIKSYNHAAVTQAQRQAEDARDTAGTRTGDRREKERAAVQAAEDTRDVEARLDATRISLDRARADLGRQSARLDQIQRQLQSEQDPNVKQRLTKEEGEAKSAEGKARDAVTSLSGRVAELESRVVRARESERERGGEVARAQAAEDRAAENQFRTEVAAATINPDTYVPGNITSRDPVTQVSVSVIGEGLIQLRGPIRGINKVRTMINQIDSPVGQVKVGVFTVQVNGEHGNRMEKVASRIEGHVDISRFLTSQSLGLLRRAIQETAAIVAAGAEAQYPGHRQLDRDRKYLYAFFGRDFIDELYEMDSEFLRSENKLLSLHSMDTVSLSQALFILALAKNDIRQQILQHFDYLVKCDLPQAEFDFRKSSRLLPSQSNTLKEVAQNACNRYHFRNLHGFFEATVPGTDTMTPTQREFIRLAQIFKSQMVAEVELKQRVIERGLIADPSFFITSPKDLERIQTEASGRYSQALQDIVRAEPLEFSRLLTEVRSQISKDVIDRQLEMLTDGISQVDAFRSTLHYPVSRPAAVTASDIEDLHDLRMLLREQIATIVQPSLLLSDSLKGEIRAAANAVERNWPLDGQKGLTSTALQHQSASLKVSINANLPAIQRQLEAAQELLPELLPELIERLEAFRRVGEDPESKLAAIDRVYQSLLTTITKFGPEADRPAFVSMLLKDAQRLYENRRQREVKIAYAQSMIQRTRPQLDHRKMLDFLIDEQEEKFIELVEGTRAHVAQIDNYLKRLAIALEDDFKVQFHDPAFAEIRRASREWDVNLGQVERTTILTNNRQFAKVSPQATMEFDLPKRDIMITEAMNGARAIVDEYGNLLTDPTFLSLTAMLSGSPAVGGVAGVSPVPGLPGQGIASPSVRNVLPGLPTDTGEQSLVQSGQPPKRFGSALESLIPDPAVYKFETGTGFEIRPVIQPDGHSIVFDFDYMYTTNVREPIRPDEKHLGRVKRHFIHTQVQTSSFELREVSRYQVALKASRTSRGVPLLEDVPGVGALFRPLPSAESSLQQNIILAQSTVYPTLFDLMGLHWSKHLVDLDHIALRDLEHVVRGRQQSIKDFTFDEASRRVDEFLDIKNRQPDHLRSDLYHRKTLPSPYHPGGYRELLVPDEHDPTGRSFDVPDRRPDELRDPPYDSRYRRPVEYPSVVPAPMPTAPPWTTSPGVHVPPPVDAQGSRTNGRSGTSIQQVHHERPAVPVVQPTRPAAAQIPRSIGAGKPALVPANPPAASRLRSPQSVDVLRGSRG